MLSDEELEYTRRIALGTGSKHTLDLLDEIARLRAMVESAEANAKLHFEAAEEMRAAMSAKTRDARAERIGRAVLACMDEEQLRANDLRKFDSFDDTDGYSIDVPKYDVSGLLAAIADALEEP